MGKFEYKDINEYVNDNIDCNWHGIKDIYTEQKEIAKHKFKPEVIYKDVINQNSTLIQDEGSF